MVWLPWWEISNVKAALDAGGNFLVLDHRDGRSDAEENLQPLCWRCNCAKAGRSNYQFKLSLSLKRLGRPVVFYPSVAKLIGMGESIFLAQLLYWTPRARNEMGDGWIYKSAEELEEETGLTYRQQRLVRRRLRKFGFLEECNRRTEHRLYFRVVPEAVDKLMETPGAPNAWSHEHMTKSQVVPNQTSGGTLPNVISYKETESTTESTQKKNLRRQTTPPSSPSNGKLKTQTSQQKRFACIGKLASAAMMIRQTNPDYSDGDLVEALKAWAARHDIPYFDAWPSAATPIEQAITIANQRTASP